MPCIFNRKTKSYRVNSFSGPKISSSSLTEKQKEDSFKKFDAYCKKIPPEWCQLNSDGCVWKDDDKNNTYTSVKKCVFDTDSTFLDNSTGKQVPFKSLSLTEQSRIKNNYDSLCPYTDLKLCNREYQGKCKLVSSHH